MVGAEEFFGVPVGVGSGLAADTRRTLQILVHARAPPESYATSYVGNSMTAPLPPPGWYPDPGANTQRYFDGTKWTDPEGYAPPSQHPYFGLTPPPPRLRNGLGIASLVLGIIAFVFSWVPFGGVILGICAVVTGVAARKRVRSGEADNNSATIASIALGIVAIIIGGLISTVLLYLMLKYQWCIAGAHDRAEYAQCH
jgi:hypothetical protein